MFDERDSHPFSVTEINTLIIPSLLRRDRATGMPRSLTIERNVSALRVSHGNVFWLDMTVAVVMVVVLERGCVGVPAASISRSNSRFSQPSDQHRVLFRVSRTGRRYTARTTIFVQCGGQREIGIKGQNGWTALKK